MLPSKPVPIVYLGLGSNLGDRREHLRRAVAELRREAGAEIVAASALYATAAIGIENGPEFLNAAIGLRVDLEPEDLLGICLGIELAAGRVRASAVAAPASYASRPLDLDLLLWGDESRNTPELTLPHPRLRERAFVLAPLSEIAPGVLLHGRTIAAWAAAAGTAGVVRQDGTEDWSVAARA